MNHLAPQPLSERPSRLPGARTLSAEEWLVGGELGIEVAAVPLARWPLRLHIGGRYGGLHPIDDDYIADGYNAFKRAFDLVQFDLGASYRF